MKRLVADGADITAIIPRYQNRLIHPEAWEKLLRRKRTSQAALCAAIGITPKSLWRFTHRQRVLPVVVGWRITSALHCRIGDFTVQYPDAANVARANTILWETRDFTRQQLSDLLEAISLRLRDAP